MRREERFQTDEQVQEYVSKALDLIHKLDVSDHLQEAVFLKACDLYAGKQIFFEQFAPPLLDGSLGRR